MDEIERTLGNYTSVTQDLESNKHQKEKSLRHESILVSFVVQKYLKSIEISKEYQRVREKVCRYQKRNQNRKQRDLSMWKSKIRVFQKCVIARDVVASSLQRMHAFYGSTQICQRLTNSRIFLKLHGQHTLTLDTRFMRHAQPTNINILSHLSLNNYHILYFIRYYHLNTNLIPLEDFLGINLIL